MKKELKERAELYAESTDFPNAVYFSQNASDARYKKEKYFFKYLNTHVVAESFITQKELNDFLKRKGI